MPYNWSGSQPIGINELEENAATRYTLGAMDALIRADAIRCCVKDCPRWLAKRRRGCQILQSICPEHGLSVSTSPTYVYKDYRNNFIIGVPRLEQVKRLKVESWRLGNERSEDALSWNCFVGLARLGGLRVVVRALTGVEPNGDPELFMWGVRVFDQTARLWTRLSEVRNILEVGAGFPTEPDVILRVRGQVIILIEAKFGSPNSTLAGQEDRFGSVTEFLDQYPSRDQVDPLDRAWIEQQAPGAVLQQLVRNVVFAQWLADERETPYVVNLVRRQDEQDVEQRFSPHLAPTRPVQFKRWTWEDLFHLLSPMGGDAQRLTRYLKNKTCNFHKAFDC
jgi:hypothetical protein